jgi:hypothetical protein
MKKRAVIIILIAVGVIILLGIVCFMTNCFGLIKNNDGVKPVISENLTEEWIANASLKDKLERVNKFTSLKDLKVLNSEEISSIYNIDDTTGLDIVAMNKSTSDEIEEIALINIIDKDRIDEVASKIMERKVLLREQNKDNTKIVEMIDNNDNNVIKQQGGIQIMIISKNAKQIEVEIDKMF